MAWGDDLGALAAERGPALVGYAYHLPGCGETYESEASTGPVSLDLSAVAGVDNTSVVTRVTSTNTDEDIADGAARDTKVIVTRDNVIVAQTSDAPQVPFALKNWNVGDQVTRTVTVDTSACAVDATHPAGSALPAGTYQVWAAQQVWRTIDGHSGINQSYSGPQTLTIS